jgi:hypothetical protein
MTCQRSDIYWRDALYNAVSQMPGNVRAAAAYLTERRGKTIAAESLRKKLRGLEGESLSMEMAEMLTEWMQELSAGQALATCWIQSLGAQFELAMDFVPPAPEHGWPDEVAAMQAKLLHVAKHAGRLSGVALEALDDAHLSLQEADLMVDELQAIRTMCHRLERNVRRAAAKGRKRG